jgi:hypothetical protein
MASRLAGLALAACSMLGLAALAGAGCEAKLGEPYVDVPACAPATAEGLLGCVDPLRYTLALDELARERPPGSEGWQLVQDRCVQTFEQLGFAVERHEYGTGVNVIGTKPGVETPDESVMISAHYDHIPGCVGADDNATGVAGVFAAAGALSRGRFAKTLIVACWDEEETGIIGSQAYAVRAAQAGQRIKVSFVFEMLGYKSDEPQSQMLPPGFELIFKEAVAELDENDRRGDFILLVNDELSRGDAQALERFAAVAALPTTRLELTQTQKTSALFGDLRRSDHASFWDRDYPSVQITDTANFRNVAYHCKNGPDERGRLNDAFAVQAVQATVGAAAEALGVR